MKDLVCINNRFAKLKELLKEDNKEDVQNALKELDDYLNHYYYKQVVLLKEKIEKEVPFGSVSITKDDYNFTLTIEYTIDRTYSYSYSLDKPIYNSDYSFKTIVSNWKQYYKQDKKRAGFMWRFKHIW